MSEYCAWCGEYESEGAHPLCVAAMVLGDERGPLVPVDPQVEVLTDPR